MSIWTWISLLMFVRNDCVVCVCLVKISLILRLIRDKWLSLWTASKAKSFVLGYDAAVTLLLMRSICHVSSFADNVFCDRICFWSECISHSVLSTSLVLLLADFADCQSLYQMIFYFSFGLYSIDVIFCVCYASLYCITLMIIFVFFTNLNAEYCF